MCARNFHAHHTILQSGCPAEFCLQLLGQVRRIAPRQRQHIRSDRGTKRLGRVTSPQLPVVQDSHAVATRRLVHQMRGQHHRHAEPSAQLFENAPQIQPRHRIQPGRRFVEQQHARTRQQALRDLHAPLQPARKRLHAVRQPILHPQRLRHFPQPRFQRRPAQPVKISAVTQILRHRQLRVETRRLEHHSERLPHGRSFPRHIVPADPRQPAARCQQGRQNPEKCRFAAAVRTEQTENFPLAHGESHIIQRHPRAVNPPQCLRFDRIIHQDSAGTSTAGGCTTRT